MIFVTGATGHVGSHVVRLLKLRGVRMRVSVRPSGAGEISKSLLATDLLGSEPEVVAFDFLDPTTYHRAVAGCDAVFLLRPPAIANTRDTLIPFLDVARAQGVRQVVFVSVMGAESNPLVPHHAVEKHLKSGPASWTILRSGFFAQNFIDAYREDICRDNRIYVPAGAAKVAFIDTHDIAEVAVTALLHVELHQGQAHALTGPQALSFAAAAALLSTELDRHITYEPASVLGYMRHLQQRGLPAKQNLVQTLLHAGLRFGQAGKVTNCLSDLLGRPASTLAEFMQREHLEWKQNLRAA